MSSYYNNIPIYETINVSYGNIETLDTTTLKTKNLYIDNVKSSNKIITQTLTLDTKDIEELTISTNPSYTNDNKKICSKGYIDEKIDNATPDLSSCVKNNENQTLTNKFIMSNSNNEFTANKLKIKDYDNNSNTDTIEKIKTGGNSDNDTLTTKGYVDNKVGVGKNYYVSDTLKGEIFNDYTNNQASGSYSHCEGAQNNASNDYSHCEGRNNTASGYYSHCEGQNNTASSYYTHAGGYHTQADQQSQTAIGEYNTTSNTNALLSVGNGTSNNSRSDALVVYRDGEVKINSTATDTTPKLTLGTSKSITATTALSSSTQANDAIITTKYYTDYTYQPKGSYLETSECLVYLNHNVYFGPIDITWRYHALDGTYKTIRHTYYNGMAVFNDYGGGSYQSNSATINLGNIFIGDIAGDQNSDKIVAIYNIIIRNHTYHLMNNQVLTGCYNNVDSKPFLVSAKKVGDNNYYQLFWKDDAGNLLDFINTLYWNFNFSNIMIE